MDAAERRMDGEEHYVGAEPPKLGQAPRCVDAEPCPIDEARHGAAEMPRHIDDVARHKSKLAHRVE